MLCKSGEYALFGLLNNRLSSTLSFTFLCSQISDECGIGYCPDCHISYTTCQYCEKECCGYVLMIVWRFVEDVIERIVGIVMNAMLQTPRGKEIM